jgi:hypothetical protein
MADAARIRKLKLKPDRRSAVIDAPDGYVESLTAPPDGVEVATELEGEFDWIQLFVRNRTDLERRIAEVERALRPESLLWITYPKGSSKIQTDLTRDRGWESVRDTNLMWINLISLDGTWSAFSLRPYRAGEARQTFR